MVTAIYGAWGVMVGGRVGVFGIHGLEAFTVLLKRIFQIWAQTREMLVPRQMREISEPRKSILPNHEHREPNILRLKPF